MANDRNDIPWILAIDFGTSYTVGVAKLAGRPAEVIEVAGDRRVPSVVVIEPDGNVLVGRAAEDLASSNPAGTLRAPKVRLGDPVPVMLNGRLYDVVDLIAMVLYSIREEAVRQYGSEPVEVRLTHPATWRRNKLDALTKAARRAGLGEPELVPEPVAAALSHAKEIGVPDGAFIAVYDLGGGTFDTAIVNARGDGFTVVGRPSGDESVGGELFDEILFEHIVADLPDNVREQLASEDRQWSAAASGLRDEVRRAKETLSSSNYVEVRVALPVGLTRHRVTREEFERLIAAHIEHTVDLLARCVEESGVDPNSLAAIYLVGGSSRAPIVERYVQRSFPSTKVSRRGDPKTAVALGAVLATRAGSTTDPGLVEPMPVVPVRPPVLGANPPSRPSAPSTPVSQPPVSRPPVSQPPVSAPSNPPVPVTPTAPTSSPPIAPQVGAPAAATPPNWIAPGHGGSGGTPSYGLQPEHSKPSRRGWVIAAVVAVLVAGGVATALALRSDDPSTESSDTGVVATTGTGFVTDPTNADTTDAVDPTDSSGTAGTESTDEPGTTGEPDTTLGTTPPNTPPITNPPETTDTIEPPGTTEAPGSAEIDSSEDINPYLPDAGDITAAYGPRYTERSSFVEPFDPLCGVPAPPPPSVLYGAGNQFTRMGEIEVFPGARIFGSAEDALAFLDMVQYDVQTSCASLPPTTWAGAEYAPSITVIERSHDDALDTEQLVLQFFGTPSDSGLPTLSGWVYFRAEREHITIIRIDLINGSSEDLGVANEQSRGLLDVMALQQRPLP